MKTETVFICNSCNKSLLKWMGRCPGCGEWNTVVEKQVEQSRKKLFKANTSENEDFVLLENVSSENHARIRTGIDELDRVLGGGIVRSSLILIGGDPGIGKSTLLLQALSRVAESGEKVVYVSGEESAIQIKLRAQRLHLDNSGVLILVENELEQILDKLRAQAPAVLVLDSVQSIYTAQSEAQAGSVAQVRNTAAAFMEFVKKSTSACFLVGHVTKDGFLAGPKTLEHMVDTVVYFEGERSLNYRILRAVKNRFGSVSEIGVFEMTDFGLRQVSCPSELFLAEKPDNVSGSVVTSIIEGSRPILAEIQALVCGPVSGQGRRTCLGIDSQRLALIVAVLEKKLGYTFYDQDIFLNSIGGIRAQEPGVDLAVAASLISSFVDRPILERTLIFGEIGLAGEVRSVSRPAERINEALRMGYGRIIAPVHSLQNIHIPTGVSVTGINKIADLAPALFG